MRLTRERRATSRGLAPPSRPWWLAGILHAGMVVTAHTQRLREDQTDRAPRARVSRRTRSATAGLTVTRLANSTGRVAGTTYSAGRRWSGTSIDVTIFAGSVRLSRDGQGLQIHPIRHNWAKELGAFTNPKGPRRKNSAAGNVAYVPELICHSRTDFDHRSSPVSRLTGGATCASEAQSIDQRSRHR